MAILFLLDFHGYARFLLILLDVLFFSYIIFTVSQHALSCIRVGLGNYALFCFV
uniref:Uncharacterized protein n=1 Tax=Arundo donax TaxID=35708 RepID=A0A0A8Z3Y8_ARUDO